MAHHHELVMLDDVLSLETFLADHLPDSYYQYLTVEMNKYHGPQLNQEFQRLLSRQESAEEESATSTWLILDKIFISFFCKNNDKDISSVRKLRRLLYVCRCAGELVTYRRDATASGLLKWVILQ